MPPRRRRWSLFAPARSPITPGTCSTPTTSSASTTCAWPARRLRAALEIFEPCFPEAQHEEALTEVKAVADALGERRDADVTIAALERFTENLAAPDRPGVASLVVQMRAEQAEANERLEPFVQPLRLAALSERLSELVVEAEGLDAEEPA